MTGNRDAQRKRELRKRLNSPIVVAALPAADCSRRMDEAVRVWWHDIFEHYDVDPSGSDRWEQIAWRLAIELFPNFRIVGPSKKIGAPTTQDKVDKLLALFEASNPPVTYKQFLRDHECECHACEIRSDRSLRDAIYRSRKRRKSTEPEDILVRLGTMKALGII
jgi:hypothetical protein